MAEVALAATVAEAGTVSEALLSERATTVPPVGADWFRVTMHVVDALELTLVGLQAKAVVGLAAPRGTVADWVVVRVAAVAVKVAEVALAGTVTDAGTVSEVLLSESATTVPPVGAD